MRSSTEASPFARAFFVMIEGLGLVPEVAAPEAQVRAPRVRVVPPAASAPPPERTR